MEIRKISGALGAVLLGVDLAAGLSAPQAKEIRQALLDNLVIFVRNQNLTPEQFLDFARAMGQPIEYPFVKGLESFPHIIEVKKLEHEKVNFGGIWHSDIPTVKFLQWYRCCCRVRCRLTVGTRFSPTNIWLMKLFPAP